MKKFLSLFLVGIFSSCLAIAQEENNNTTKTHYELKKGARKMEAGHREKIRGEHMGQMMEKHFTMMDGDKNGQVSKQEWSDFHNKRFQEMDLNKDGAVEKTEFDGFHQKMREKHGMRKMDEEMKRGDMKDRPNEGPDERSS